MTKTYLTLIGYRAWYTESLKTFSDCSGSVCRSCAALLYCDCYAYDISPESVLKAYRLNIIYLLVYIKNIIISNFIKLLKR